MPYIVVGKCVHKKNPDGSAGETVKCHESTEEAQAHMRALYANVDKGQFVVKEVGGVYYWTGHPSNNARDREWEIVSEKALSADVADTSARDNPAPLRYGHLKVRIGPEPDWRGVIDGVLVESGRFDDTPLAKAVARHVMDNPESFDGNGWGMSIGFRGVPDAEGVFHQVRIHERSILPRSRAANPYTSFAAGGDMNELDKAALSEIEKILKSSALSPEAVETAKAMLSAKDQAKALDEADVQRKAADPAPDAEDADVDKAKPFKPGKPEDEKPPMADAEEENGEDEEAKKPAAKKPKGKAKAAPVEPVAAVAPIVADDLAEPVLKDITAYVDNRVSSTVEEQTKAINDALETLVDHLSTLSDQIEALERRDKGLAAANEMPRGVLEKMKALSAAMSTETVIDETDPLATKKLAPAPDNPLAIFRK